MTQTFATVVPGSGTTFSFTPIGQSVTTLIQVQSIEAPSLEMGTWESTPLGASSKQFIPTIPDGGEVSLVLIYDPSNAGHALITTTMLAKTLCSCAVAFAGSIGSISGATGTAHTETFYAYFTGFQATSIEVESGVLANVKLKVTGDVTFA